MMQHSLDPTGAADATADATAGTTRAPASPLLELENVTYRYPGSHAAPALNGLTLRIGQGEHVALLGHNGSGKSTLMRLLGGLLLPSSGRIRVAGVDTKVEAARRLVRAHVGMIFSDPDNQIVATVVEDDVGWGLAARGLPRDVIATRVSAALDAVGLGALRNVPPEQLSGGQRQRLAIAGILALEPSCILADEPTSQLDPRARLDVMALLHGLRQERGITLVHATHLLEEAALADRVLVLEGGAVALDDTPARVFADLDRLRALRLVIPDLAQLGERLRALGIAIPPDALTPEAFLAALRTPNMPTTREARP